MHPPVRCSRFAKLDAWMCDTSPVFTGWAAMLRCSGLEHRAAEVDMRTCCDSLAVVSGHVFAYSRRNPQILPAVQLLTRVRRRRSNHVARAACGLFAAGTLQVAPNDACREAMRVQRSFACLRTAYLRSWWGMS